MFCPPSFLFSSQCYMNMKSDTEVKKRLISTNYLQLRPIWSLEKVDIPFLLIFIKLQDSIPSHWIMNLSLWSHSVWGRNFRLSVPLWGELGPRKCWRSSAQTIILFLTIFFTMGWPGEEKYCRCHRRNSQTKQFHDTLIRCSSARRSRLSDEVLPLSNFHQDCRLFDSINCEFIVWGHFSTHRSWALRTWIRSEPWDFRHKNTLLLLQLNFLYFLTTTTNSSRTLSEYPMRRIAYGSSSPSNKRLKVKSWEYHQTRWGGGERQ